MKPPCHGCNIRSPTCHGTCEKYKAFAAEIEQRREKRLMEHNATGLRYDTAQKTKRRR